MIAGGLLLFLEEEYTMCQQQQRIISKILVQVKTTIADAEFTTRELELIATELKSTLDVCLGQSLLIASYKQRGGVLK